MDRIVPDIDALTNEINKLSDRFKIRNEQGPKKKDQHKNAFAHAYASAVLRYENNLAYSNFGGTLREYKEFPVGSYKAIRGKKGYTLDGVWRDGHRDMYNNHIGNQIAAFAKKNSLPREAIAYLVLDAVKNKQLVLNEFEDPRVGILSFVDPKYKGPSWDGLKHMKDDLRLEWP